MASAGSSYIDRCKTIGRLGPMLTELDKSSLFGEAIIKKDPLTLSINEQQSENKLN